MGRGGGEARFPFPVPATVRRSPGGEDVGVVSEPVQQSGGEFGIAEDLYPFTEGAIGGVLLAHCTIGRNVTSVL